MSNRLRLPREAELRRGARCLDCVSDVRIVGPVIEIAHDSTCPTWNRLIDRSGEVAVIVASDMADASLVDLLAAAIYGPSRYGERAGP